MSKLHRMSRSSLQEDQFFSAPSSRTGSRHVSTHITPDNGPGSDPGLESWTMESASQPNMTTVGNTQPGPVDPTQERTASPSKVKWVLPFTGHQHEPKHHHLCPKPVIQRYNQSRSSPSKGVPNQELLEFRGNGEGSEGSVRPERLMSSSAPPVTTERWSSIGIGEKRYPAKRPRRSSTLIDPEIEIDDPATVRQGIEAIVSSIRAYLSNRRHNDCPSQSSSPGAIDGNERGSKGASAPGVDQHVDQKLDEAVNHYLVSTNDIAGILDIVIAGLRYLRDENLPTGCLSVLLLRDPNARPTTVIKAIIPPATGLADPATTISSVQPFFSIAGCQVSQTSRGSSTQCTKSTIISRQSVTEVSWDPTSERSTRRGSQSSRSIPKAALLHLGRDANRNPSYPPFTPTSPPVPRPESATPHTANQFADQFLVKDILLERRPSSTPLLESRKIKEAREKQVPISAPVGSPMISFPRLGQRSTTNYWISPPERDEETLYQHRAAPSTLYMCGVDAHSGITCPSPMPQAQGGATASSTLYTCGVDAHFGIASPPSTSQTQVETAATKTASEASQPPPIDKPENKMGFALGTFAHRRNSSLLSAESREQPNPDAPLLDKLRRYTLLPILDQTSGSSLRTNPLLPSTSVHSTPNYELPLQGQRKSSSKAMLEDILAKSPPTRRPTRRSTGFATNMFSESGLGLRKASRKRTTGMMGTFGTTKKRCVSCTEDQRPHACVDEVMTPTPTSTPASERGEWPG
ncbi:hypothetical protein BJ170DRAFT_681100 [Xylariales sp. AK1849]|nr:hypothetical protein BJ170DRAFT_681100 [Xylariales sp. AK1849]